MMKPNVNAIIDYINENNITTPVKLSLEIVKVSKDGLTRFMRAYINERNVTAMIANFTGKKQSTARATYGLLIVKGIGMDMCWSVQYSAYQKALQNGYPAMFDPEHYIYIERIAH